MVSAAAYIPRHTPVAVVVPRYHGWKELIVDLLKAASDEAELSGGVCAGVVLSADGDTPFVMDELPGLRLIETKEYQFPHELSVLAPYLSLRKSRMAVGGRQGAEEVLK